MKDILADICATKRNHITLRKAEIPENALHEKLAAAGRPRGFRQALQFQRERGQSGLITEIKKASPSKGLIRPDFDPAALAEAYAAGGAACLSVLTDEPYFQGRDEYLVQARAAVSIPVLRKDFMLDPYQILESRVLGADRILLIMAALTNAQARELEAAAFELHMDVLVEVHDKDELDRALTHLKPALIGINNRNLKTLTVDLATSESLVKYLPQHILCVCESGIASHDDVQRMRRAGISSFLVGESLMLKQDVMRATQLLLGIGHG